MEDDVVCLEVGGLTWTQSRGREADVEALAVGGSEFMRDLGVHWVTVSKGRGRSCGGTAGFGHRGDPAGALRVLSSHHLFGTKNTNPLSRKSLKGRKRGCLWSVGQEWGGQRSECSRGQRSPPKCAELHPSPVSNPTPPPH